MPHFKLTLGYDGTDYVGWQRQTAGTSIQGLLEDALSILNGGPVAVTGAGRTDAGVHALGQVASVTLDRETDAATVVRASNARLPGGVRVLRAEEVPAAFHARFDAIAKTYRYRIWNHEVLSPFERPFVWHVPTPVLDVAAMASAAVLIEGRHDFAAFQAAGTDTSTTEREIFSSAVVPASDGGALIVYEIRGEGFLRHMVRAIVGSLVDVGRGRVPPTWLSEVLASKTRALAGRTAPPSGLFLVQVDYATPDL